MERVLAANAGDYYCGGLSRRLDLIGRGDSMTCNHDHDREQQKRFEDDIQTIIDRACETEKVCELVSALQKALAGVLACDVIADGDGNERIHDIATGVAEYIIQVHSELEEAEKGDANRTH